METESTAKVPARVTDRLGSGTGELCLCTEYEALAAAWPAGDLPVGHF